MRSTGARRVLVVFAAAVGLAGCAALPPLLGGSQEARWASRANIMRDAWGVPTVYGPDGATVMFGLAWAHAEDGYERIEDEYIHALGYAAGYYGEAYLAADLVKAAFRIEELSREEYARESPVRRVLWDAYAAGLNHYMEVNAVRPKVITRWEPWMFLARARAMTLDHVAPALKLGGEGSAGDGGGVTLVGSLHRQPDAAERLREVGSLAWAIAPSRTATGAPLLLMNPPPASPAGAAPYEMHVHSSDGWHVRGFGVAGLPAIQAGRNESLAWTHTLTDGDMADEYVVTFDHPSDPLMYRYDDGWHSAETWTDTLWVNTSNGLTRRGFTFIRTHLGPVVARGSEGRAHVMRVAGLEEGGALQQWHAMSRASDMNAFRAAFDGRALATFNTIMADAAGNILYVPGDTMPDVLNPDAGWIVSAGGASSGADGQAHPRERTSLQILEADSVWSAERLAAAAFDARVPAADDGIAVLVHEWELIGATNPVRAAQLDEAMDTLRAWDRVVSTESAAATLYVLWQQRLRQADVGGYRYFRAFEDAVQRMQTDFGATTVPWGEVHRLRHVAYGPRGAVHDTSAPGLPLPAAPAWTGVVFAADTRPDASGRWTGPWLQTPIAVVDLGAGGGMRTVVPFGQSLNAGSPHAFDQAELYAGRQLKPAPFTREEVASSAVRSYRPGDR